MLSFMMIPILVIALYSLKKWRINPKIEYDDTIDDELHLYAANSVNLNKLIDDINLENYDNVIMEDFVKKQIWIKIMDIEEDTKRFILSEMHNNNYKVVFVLYDKKLL
jgi:hypothetical protein